ncbi:intraflagellar transport protein 27 homolog isoform X1 [Lampetra fluviatilis]
MVVLRAKCLVAGESTVGKSALVQAFHSDATLFPKNYNMTVGVELLVKSVGVPDTTDSVEIYLYDSGGKDIFNDLVQKNWDHPSMLCLVFDVTSEQSLGSCGKWLERVRAQSPGVPFPGVLVGNKVDLGPRRVVSAGQGQEFATANGLEYFETSAKEMENIDTPFLFLAKAFHRLYVDKTDFIKSLV